MEIEKHTEAVKESSTTKTPPMSQIFVDNDLPSIGNVGAVTSGHVNLVHFDPRGVNNDSEEQNYPNTSISIEVMNNIEAEPPTNAPTSIATTASNVSSLASTVAADAALTLKIKEERKKEREKKKEEELLKKYMAEQEAKQKVIGTSRCGRWLKNSNKIGEGGYKFVYRGYDRQEARTVAWCEFKHEHVDTKEKRQIMFRETEIMLKMNHPHIVRCFDVFREWTNEETVDNPLEQKGLVIIQELMSEGTLKQVIRKNFLDGQCILKFQLLTRWWHQIVDALRYMHHQLETPIIHRDLKSDNCFLYGVSDEEYLNVKVGDFGLATQVGSSGRKTMLGTVGFMAPEIFDEMYDEKVDIYAFGMLMLEVMTNRAPYDECTTLFEAAAKTMSGHGPAIMQLITNPNLSVLISACIHPLGCFRPSAEELFCHPLFQTNMVKTAVSSLQSKTIPVEVEPNYEPGTDRVEVLERFVRSLANPESRDPRFNLRLRFRDPKILQELGLDEGESLEFDLDIYKAENQDIPDLITSLRRDYEDKLSRAFANPKLTDRKIVSNHLDRLFNSIRMQMQFLVKCLLGKRWKDILNSLSTKEEQPKEKPVAQEGQESKAEGAAVDSEEEPDSDIVGCSNFEIIAKCKSKWLRAKRLLDREIQAYRKAAALAESGCALQIGGSVPTQPNNPLTPPQPTGLTGTPSPALVTAPDGAPSGITLPPSNLVVEAPLSGEEDPLATNQILSKPSLFASAASQQDYSKMQPAFSTAFSQTVPSNPSVSLPSASQPPHCQATFIRLPAQAVSSQPQPPYPSPTCQHQNSLVSSQHMPYEVPSNPGGAAVRSTILQNVQPRTVSSFPVLVGSVEQQSMSATAGLTYMAQQPTRNCSATGLPSNFTLQQSQQQQQQQQQKLQQGIVEERWHEMEANSDTEAPDYQRVAASIGVKPKRKISQAKQPLSQQPLRYIIRITRLERESEGCDKPDTLRPTFYLEMPDVNNPNSELWKLSFRCNLSDTTDDIKLFEGCGYTQTNEEVDRAIKEAVAGMLRALQADENSIPLNHDYVFYPQLSPELISASSRSVPLATASKELHKEEVGQPPVVPDSAASFGSPHDGDLSNATSTAESPVERNLRPGLTGVAGLQATLSNISPYTNQLTSVSSYPGHSGLEEVPPIFTIGQPENVCPSKSISSFPVLVDSSHLYSSEPGNVYDSTESLVLYNNALYAHPMGSQTKEPEFFTTLKVPAHAQSLVAQFAHHLCTSRRNDPLLIVPSDANTAGCMSVLTENCSFLCSRNEIGGGFSVMPIPSSSSFVEVQNRSASQGRVIRAPHNGFIVVTPNGELHNAQRPLIILPGNSQRPLIELPLLSGDGSSIQLNDMLTLLIHLREGMANTSTSASISREHSVTDIGVGTSQPQVRQQDTNYYSLPYGAMPMNLNRAPVLPSVPPTSSTFTRQVGFRSQLLPLAQQVPMRVASGSSSSICHGELSINVPPSAPSLEYAPTRPSMPTPRLPQQQFSAPTLNAFGLRADPVAQQPQPNFEYLAALWSANPSLFLATAAALNANISAPPQPAPAVPANMQAPLAEPLWNSSTSASSNSFAPFTASPSNLDAFKHILFRSALENMYYQQQQQPPPMGSVVKLPTMATVPSSATGNAPMQSGVAASTEIYDPSSAQTKPILPTAPITLFQPTRLPQPVMGVNTSQQQIGQQHQFSGSVASPLPQLCTATEAQSSLGTKKPASLPHMQPPATAVAVVPPLAPPNRSPSQAISEASRFVVAPPNAGPSIRESITTSSLSIPPPLSLPPHSQQGTIVVGNRFTVVSLDSSGTLPNPVEPSHPQIPQPPPPPPPPPPPLLPPQTLTTSSASSQTGPSGSSVQRGIHSKFTVAPVTNDITDDVSRLAASSATDSISSVPPLCSDTPFEAYQPSECPPPPSSTPAMSNQSSIVEQSIPPTPLAPFLP